MEGAFLGGFNVRDGRGEVDWGWIGFVWFVVVGDSG